MAQRPAVIRREIDDTRAEMDETIDAIAYRADVKERAKEKISEKGQEVRRAASSVKHQIESKVPSGGDIKGKVEHAAHTAQQNPMMLALGAFSAGFLAGLMLPSSRTEEQKLGSVAERAIDTAREVGEEAMAEGREAAEDIAHSAEEKLRETGKQAARRGKQAAKQVARKAKSEVRSGGGRGSQAKAKQPASRTTRPAGRSTSSSRSGSAKKTTTRR